VDIALRLERSAAQAVITTDVRQRPSLADVGRIEKVGHATRKAVAIGFLTALPTVIDAVHKPGNVIYPRPGAFGSFAVRPILTPGRQGVAFATRW
jgi:hypothetical protein